MTGSLSVRSIFHKEGCPLNLTKPNNEIPEARGASKPHDRESEGRAVKIRKVNGRRGMAQGLKLGVAVAAIVATVAGLAMLGVRGLAFRRGGGAASGGVAARDVLPEVNTAIDAGMECGSVLAAEDSSSVLDPAGGPRGDIAAVRRIADPYPEFSGVAGDVADGRLVFGDGNHRSLMIYNRTGGSQSPETTQPRQRIMGDRTNLGFISSVAIDQKTGDYYAIDNDTEDRIAVFAPSADGNALPLRVLYTPHQAYGLSLDPQHQELAVTVEQLNAVLIYRLNAKGLEAPLRVIHGPSTGMADPHGVFIDPEHNEIVVASIGNFRPGGGFGTPYLKHFGPLLKSKGRFLPPSLTFYSTQKAGDQSPLRTIQGPDTGLNWPMAITEDVKDGEIAVANNGDNSILIFNRTESGDAKPIRVIRGPRTGLDLPLGVYIDTRHNELWVANFGNHSATVYPWNAKGDVAPKRIVRNAPAGTPTAGLGNPMAVAYNPAEQEILVAN